MMGLSMCCRCAPRTRQVRLTNLLFLRDWQLQQNEASTLPSNITVNRVTFKRMLFNNQICYVKMHGSKRNMRAWEKRAREWDRWVELKEDVVFGDISLEDTHMPGEDIEMTDITPANLAEFHQQLMRLLWRIVDLRKDVSNSVLAANLTMMYDIAEKRLNVMINKLSGLCKE